MICGVRPVGKVVLESPGKMRDRECNNSPQVISSWSFMLPNQICQKAGGRRARHF